MGSILGGILGGGSTPGQAQQEAALRNATEAYRQYRPEAMQARINAMNTIASAYQGANNALETLWGAPPVGGGSPMQRLGGGGLSAAPQRPAQRPGSGLPPPPEAPSPGRGPVPGMPTPGGIMGAYRGFFGGLGKGR